MLLLRLLFFLLLFICSRTQCQTLDSLQMLNDLRELSSEKFEGRRSGTYGGRLTNYFLSQRFKQIGLLSYRQDFKHAFVFNDHFGYLPGATNSSMKKLTYGFNIIGYLKGKTDSAFVISAHFDHLGKINGKVYPGANDNASGTSALLAIATYLKNYPTKHTLIFAAFDAEESNMNGAQAFMQDILGVKALIRLNINMDMIGANSGNQLFIGGPNLYPKLKKLMGPLMKAELSIDLQYGYDGDITSADTRLFNSDHAVFYQQKIPFIYFGVPVTSAYHKPEDDFSSIDPGFFVRSTRFILKSIMALDRKF